MRHNQKRFNTYRAIIHDDITSFKVEGIVRYTQS